MSVQARVVTEIPGPRSRAVRARESKHLAPGTQAISAYAGIAVASGQGCDVIDVDGNRFLDIVAGVSVAAVGYAHPRFTKALKAQVDRVHVGSFTTDVRVEALEKIAALTPEGLDQVQLFSGGSEAVESAVRLARAHTGRFEVLSFWGGYHGKTAGALAQMGSPFKQGLGPLMPGALLTPYADCNGCTFHLKHPECRLACADFARDKLRRESAGSVAAILVEPVQGTAGNLFPPTDWLPAIADLAREIGALLIVDEMITGFGRTGRPFACERTGTVPDIITVGKGLGGGFPVSAVVTREELAHTPPWSNPSFSSSSYGGNPLAGAAIAASVGIIADEGLIDNSRDVGAHFLKGLHALSERHPCVQNVRGEGLLLGFDLVHPSTGELWTRKRCIGLFKTILRLGMLTMAYTPRVRINPPLIFTRAEADEALTIFDNALTAYTHADASTQVSK